MKMIYDKIFIAPVNKDDIRMCQLDKTVQAKPSQANKWSRKYNCCGQVTCGTYLTLNTWDISPLYLTLVFISHILVCILHLEY